LKIEISKIADFNLPRLHLSPPLGDHLLINRRSLVTKN